ncbi:NAD(P)-dependent oxidoreductase [Xylophilus sp. GW821-FHT01B05]
MTTSAARHDTVGFVGLGLMGMPMARNILRAGYRLVAHDLGRDKLDEVEALGALAAHGAADVARQAAIQICMVETTEQVQSVVLGADGFAAGAHAGDIVVCMSTIDLIAVRDIHARLAERGIDFIDAPVAGMRENGGAATASLKCFAGGAPAVLERARPVLATMTSEITHFGPAGCGTAIKLINSMVMQSNRIVACEALALGAKAGLDPAQMVDLLGRTYANSGALQYDAPRILARKFETNRLGTTLKDVQLQVALGKALGMPMLMATQAQQVYQMAHAMGIRDAAAVVQVYENWTGVKVTPVAASVSAQQG